MYMDESNPCWDPDRRQSVLTKSERRFLLGDGPEAGTAYARRIRGDIRERLYHAVLDFALIEKHLEDRDRDQALGELHGPTQSGRESEEFRREQGLRTGYESMMRFFYRYLRDAEDRFRFDRQLARAVGIVELRDRHDSFSDSTRHLGPPTVDIDIGPPMLVDIDEVVDKLARRSKWENLTPIETTYCLVATLIATDAVPTDSPVREYTKFIHEAGFGQISDEDLIADGRRIAQAGKE